MNRRTLSHLILPFTLLTGVLLAAPAAVAQPRPTSGVKQAGVRPVRRAPRLLRRLTLPIRRMHHERRMKRRFFAKLKKASPEARRHYGQQKRQRKVGALRALRAGQVALTGATGYATGVYTYITAQAWKEPLFQLVAPQAVAFTGAVGGATALQGYGVGLTNRALRNRLKAARISTAEKFGFNRKAPAPAGK